MVVLTDGSDKLLKVEQEQVNKDKADYRLDLKVPAFAVGYKFFSDGITQHAAHAACVSELL